MNHDQSSNTVLTKLDGVNWLKQHANKHVARNAKQYRYKVYTGLPMENSLGFKIDPMPIEGKVVECDSHWVLLKTGRQDFFVCARSLLREPLALEAVAKITPYARRRWDGQRVDAPEEKVMGGVVYTMTTLGEKKTMLPIDKSALRSDSLRALVDWIENERAPDAVRTVAQMLIDAGANGYDVLLRDVDEENGLSPVIEFGIRTTRVSGFLRIEYRGFLRNDDRWSDEYYVALTDRSLLRGEMATVIEDRSSVPLKRLGDWIHEQVDDGEWRYAKVEILKPTRTRRSA